VVAVTLLAPNLPGHGLFLLDPIPPEPPMAPSSTSLGELIQQIYAEFLARYGDEELASVATAAVVNDLLASRPAPPDAVLEA
jgi:hypothetical protein